MDERFFEVIDPREVDRLLALEAMRDLERGEQAGEVRYRLTARGALAVSSWPVALLPGRDHAVPVEWSPGQWRWLEIDRVVVEGSVVAEGPACRVCGCTWERACAGGCWWVDDPEGLGPLCSSCLPVVAA